MDGLIYKCLSEDETLKSMLASYNKSPAVFFQKSPSDQDVLWEKPCYPRIDYTVDKIADPERNSSGLVSLRIWVSAETPTVEGEESEVALERQVKTLLHNGFFTSSTCTYCLSWMSSLFFLGKTNDKNTEATEVETFGLEVTFDLIEFHSQIVTDPDPVQGANAWMKEVFPLLTLIQYDKLPPVYHVEKGKPAAFWRLGNYVALPNSTYSVTWYQAELSLHIFAETVEDRTVWLKQISQWLQLREEIILVDGSPLFVQKLSVSHDGDPLRKGQMQLVGDYGVLKIHLNERACPPLQEIKMK